MTKLSLSKDEEAFKKLVAVTTKKTIDEMIKVMEKNIKLEDSITFALSVVESMAFHVIKSVSSNCNTPFMRIFSTFTSNLEEAFFLKKRKIKNDEVIS